MQTREGEIIKSCLDGMDYTIERIVNGMVVLESKSGNKQILTEIDTLNIRSFYQKIEPNEIQKSDFRDGVVKTLQNRKGIEAVLPKENAVMTLFPNRYLPAAKLIFPVSPTSPRNQLLPKLATSARK